MKGEINVARMCAAVGGDTHEVNIAERKKEFLTTQSEVAQEFNRLIDKIGIVNVLALLHALNGAEVVGIDVDISYSADFKAYGWFTLDACKGIAINVDEKLKWQERWCEVGKINFGLK